MSLSGIELCFPPGPELENRGLLNMAIFTRTVFEVGNLALLGILTLFYSSPIKQNYVIFSVHRKSDDISNPYYSYYKLMIITDYTLATMCLFLTFKLYIFEKAKVERERMGTWEMDS